MAINAPAAGIDEKAGWQNKHYNEMGERETGLLFHEMVFK